MEDYNVFLKSVKKVSGKRKHKVLNSYGIEDYYRYYKANTADKPLSYKEYSTILKAINLAIQDDLVEGKDVVLPQRMGRIELRKKYNKCRIVKDKLKITNPVNWQATLKLWYEDEEARESKTIVRQTDKCTYRLYYNKAVANYTYKNYYKFSFNRTLKVRLKNKIDDTNMEAFEYFY